MLYFNIIQGKWHGLVIKFNNSKFKEEFLMKMARLFLVIIAVMVMVGLIGCDKKKANNLSQDTKVQTYDDIRGMYENSEAQNSNPDQITMSREQFEHMQREQGKQIAEQYNKSLQENMAITSGSSDEPGRVRRGGYNDAGIRIRGSKTEIEQPWGTVKTNEPQIAEQALEAPGVFEGAVEAANKGNIELYVTKDSWYQAPARIDGSNPRGSSASDRRTGFKNNFPCTINVRLVSQDDSNPFSEEKDIAPYGVGIFEARWGNYEYTAQTRPSMNGFMLSNCPSATKTEKITIPQRRGKNYVSGYPDSLDKVIPLNPKRKQR